MNAIVIQSNGFSGIAEQIKEDPKPTKSFDQEREDIYGLEYAVISKKNKQNRTKDDLEVKNEDEYDKLDHATNANTEATNTNMYDTMLGVTGKDDATYNTAVHNSPSRDCQYDTFNIESL